MSFSPEWKGPVEGYVVNYLAREHWKIARTCPRDDAMQEAYCVFLRVKRKYPKLKKPQHFMALFKTAWYHQFTDLANADTRDRVTGPFPVNEAGETMEVVGDLDNHGMLALLIRDAPREIVMVLSLFLSAPQELVDAALGRDVAGEEPRSFPINRLLGLPDDFDSVGAVKEYFTT